MKQMILVTTFISLIFKKICLLKFVRIHILCSEFLQKLFQNCANIFCADIGNSSFWNFIELTQWKWIQNHIFQQWWWNLATLSFLCYPLATLRYMQRVNANKAVATHRVSLSIGFSLFFKFLKNESYWISIRTIQWDWQ